jgi:hypothetical protein
MRRIKICAICCLVGIAVGYWIGQLVLAGMKATGGLLLARDIFGTVYGFPVLFAWGGYYLGDWIDKTWKP